MRKKLMKEENGFTLVELLIVMVIIGLLVAVAVPRFINMRTEAQRSACEATQASMQTAVEQYLYYWALDDGTGGMTDPGSIADDAWGPVLSSSFTTNGTTIESLLRSEPTCSAGGTLEVDASGGTYEVTCSVH